MPTFIKTGYWEKRQFAPKKFLNLEDLIQSIPPSPELLALIDAVAGFTSLSAGVSSGVSNISVNGTSELLSVGTWLILDPFSSNCEFLKISSKTDTTITFTTALLKNHTLGTIAIATDIPLWNIVYFGAKVSNVTNVTEIQAAIDNANVFDGTIYIPTGVFKITRTATNILSLASKNNIIFDGQGSIQLTGSLASSDTFMFKADTTTSNITFRNITLDGGKDTVTNTVEQTHIVEINAGAVGGNIDAIKFENVKFINAVSDGIRMVGTDDGVNHIQYGWVKDCTFDNCGRSGVTIHRGVRYFDIIGNTFTRISDQFVDMEPSGSGFSPPNNIKIHDNTCINTTDKASLSIAGINDVAGNHAYNISVQGNTIILGGVIMVYCDNVTFINNTIVASSERGIEITRFAYNIDISDNRISGTNRGIYLGATTDTQYPNTINISKNKISMSGGYGIEIDGAADMLIDGNFITALSASDYGVSYRSTVTNDADSDKRILVTNNTIDGFTTGVTFNASPNSMYKCSVTGNILKNLTNGTLFSVGGGLEIAAVTVNNIIENVTNEYIGLSDTEYVQYSGAPGNVGHYSCEGTPEALVTAPVGSWATNRTNGAIYYKATGVGNTGWVLK